MSAIIELTRVSRVHQPSSTQKVVALREVDLRIEAGEFVCVMGPSGSGKSTLLNLVSALDTPTSGTIRIDGQDISQMGDDALTLFRRRKVGLVFQFFNLLPTLDAMDNVLLPLLLERRATREDHQRAETLLGEVGLRARADHKMYQLSGGEMQRVAIARALIHQPRILLADEPTGNLDSKIGEEILRLLQTTCRARRTTIVMVTHDRQAASYGDRLVRLKDGGIIGDEPLGGGAQHREELA